MSEETCTHCPHAVHSGPCRKTSAFTPGGCLCVQYPELRIPMSDNQPQVGTRLDAMCDVCGRAFAEHRSGLLNEAYCPRFVEAHWYGWLPTTFVPQPTPAEPRIETDLAQRAKLQARLGNRKAVIDPQDIGAPRLNEEPRIETVHDSFTCETPNCPACWGESKQEGVEGDYVGIGRNGPTPRVEAGAQPEPEEREAQAEAVNKIWNQFRSGDGEEDCELYRALEQAYGAGRARAGSSLIAEPEKRAAFMHKVPANRRLVVLEAWDDGFKAGQSRDASQDSEESFVLELAAIYGLDENFMRALPVATLDMWKMLVRKNAEQHKSERETMEMFRKELCDLKFGASPPSSPGAAQTVKKLCGHEFKLKDGYFCELPHGHAGGHEATCPNPQFHQSWPNETADMCNKCQDEHEGFLDECECKCHHSPGAPQEQK